MFLVTLETNIVGTKVVSLLWKSFQFILILMWIRSIIYLINISSLMFDLTISPFSDVYEHLDVAHGNAIPISLFSFYYTYAYNIYKQLSF